MRSHVRVLRRGPSPPARGTVLAALFLALGAGWALADWLQPDASFRDAQFMLRAAARDTVGHADDPGRLDSLGVALLRLARFEEAARAFGRVRDLRPGDPAANAGLGKLALFAGRLAEAESLLTLSSASLRDPEVLADLFAARLQRRDWAGAARLAPEVGEQGRVPLLEALAERGAYRITAGPPTARIPWARSYPVPLVKVKLNGQSALMAIDTGAPGLLIDVGWARRAKVRVLPSESRVFWSGTRLGMRNALVQQLEIGGFRVEDLPAGVASLRKWSLQVNPQGEAVAGVIGLGFLRQFTPTLDYPAHVLELRRPGEALASAGSGQRVPFEIWGEADLTVYGSLAGGRRMALVVQTGIPECGVGAPHEVFEELGLKPGGVARAIRSMGNYLQGRPWLRVTVPAVAVGPVVRDKVPGWSGALDPAEMWRHGVRRDGLLSHDFFADRRLTFDWEARELLLEERPDGGGRP